MCPVIATPGAAETSRSVHACTQGSGYQVPRRRGRRGGGGKVPFSSRENQSSISACDQRLALGPMWIGPGNRLMRIHRYIVDRAMPSRSMTVSSFSRWSMTGLALRRRDADAIQHTANHVPAMPASMRASRIFAVCGDGATNQGFLRIRVVGDVRESRAGSSCGSTESRWRVSRRPDRLCLRPIVGLGAIQFAARRHGLRGPRHAAVIASPPRVLAGVAHGERVQLDLRGTRGPNLITLPPATAIRGSRDAMAADAHSSSLRSHSVSAAVFCGM